VLPTAFGMLLREGVSGILLWSSAAPDNRIRLAATVVGLCGTILWTRRFGLLRPHSWAKACCEGLLLTIGAVCMCNLLLLGLGLAPWWR